MIQESTMVEEKGSDVLIPKEKMQFVNDFADMTDGILKNFPSASEWLSATRYDVKNYAWNASVYENIQVLTNVLSKVDIRAFVAISEKDGIASSDYIQFIENILSEYGEILPIHSISVNEYDDDGFGTQWVKIEVEHKNGISIVDQEPFDVISVEWDENYLSEWTIKNILESVVTLLGKAEETFNTIKKRNQFENVSERIDIAEGMAKQSWLIRANAENKVTELIVSMIIAMEELSVEMETLENQESVIWYLCGLIWEWKQNTIDEIPVWSDMEGTLGSSREEIFWIETGIRITAESLGVDQDAIKNMLPSIEDCVRRAMKME